MTEALGPISRLSLASLAGGNGMADGSRTPAGGIDEERMAAIRLAIAEGRYPLDFQRLAERLIELGIVREHGR